MWGISGIVLEVLILWWFRYHRKYKYRPSITVEWPGNRFACSGYSEKDALYMGKVAILCGLTKISKE